MGLACFDAGRYAKAEGYLLKSLQLKRQETADLPALARGLMNLAEAKMVLGKHEEAGPLLEEAHIIARRLKDQVVAARSLYDMAEVQRSTGRAPLSLDTYRRAERMASRVPYWGRDRSRMMWIARIRAEFSRQFSR
jgi:tetratricopeptide (TPR) repeat protein